MKRNSTGMLKRLCIFALLTVLLTAAAVPLPRACAEEEPDWEGYTGEDYGDEDEDWEDEEEDLMLLLLFCHLYVNNNDNNIGFHDLDFLYDNKRTWNRVSTAPKPSRNARSQAASPSG